MPPKKLHSIKDVFVESITDFVKDRAFMLSAALSYYAMLSVIPLLVLMITILATFTQQNVILNQVIESVGSIAGENIARMLSALISASQEDAGIASAVSIVLLLAGSTALFSHLKTIINLIWDTPQKSEGRVVAIIKNRALSFLLIISLVIIASIFAIFSLVVSSINYLQFLELGSLESIIETAINYISFFVLMTLVFAFTYKILPDKKLKYSDVIAGGIFTSLFFTVGLTILGIYFKYSSIGTPQSPMSYILAILIMFYYYSVVFLLGAEFTHNYITRYKNRLI